MLRAYYRWGIRSEEGKRRDEFDESRRNPLSVHALPQCGTGGGRWGGRRQGSSIPRSPETGVTAFPPPDTPILSQRGEPGERVVRRRPAKAGPGGDPYAPAASMDWAESCDAWVSRGRPARGRHSRLRGGAHSRHANLCKMSGEGGVREPEKGIEHQVGPFPGIKT